jgi:RimJ/RimL family protein N-acetyltransferase
MNKGDVQIMYVMTSEKHRGNGYAKQLINTSLGLDFHDLEGMVWYVTSKSNTASIKTALSIGFKKVQDI